MPRLLSRRARIDPYPLYAEMREAGPVQCDFTGVWFASSHEHVGLMLKDEELASPVRRDILGQIDDAGIPDGSTVRGVSELLFLIAGPDHRSRRSHFLEGFRAAVAEVEPLIPEIAARSLGGALEDGTLDMARWARTVSSELARRIAGIGPGADDLLWRAANAFQPMLGFRLSERELSGMKSLAQELDVKLEDGLLIEGGLASVWASGHSDRSMAVSLISSLISGMLNPLTCGLQTTLAIALANPGLLDQTEPRAVITEALRCEAPVQWVGRVLARDWEAGGSLVPKGSAVLLLVGAANRDPERFDHADLFAPGRSGSSPALSFGYGAHYCVGAGLTQSAGTAALQLIAFEELRAAEPLEWRTTAAGFRLPSAMRVPVVRASKGAGAKR